MYWFNYLILYYKFKYDLKYKLILFSSYKILNYVQKDIPRQVDFWIRAKILNLAFVFSKMCFDEKIAWGFFYWYFI